MAGNFIQAETTAPDEPPRKNIHLDTVNLRERTAAELSICNHLEKMVIPGLERELAALTPEAPLPLAKFEANDSCMVLDRSLTLEELFENEQRRCDAPAGAIISTLEGAALAELRSHHPQRRVISVSPRTLAERRKAAKHV